MHAIFEDAHSFGYAVFVGGEEEHGHAIIAFVRQQAAALLCFLTEETVRDLQQDAGAISRVALQANAATMLQVYEYRKRIVHHLMGTHAFDVGERANAACIVFERAAIHAGLWRCCLRQVRLSLLGGSLRALFCAGRFARSACAHVASLLM